MIDKSKIRTLTLLDNMISSCIKCPLYTNGRVKPYWTDKSSYVLIGNVESSDLLWEIMNAHGFTKEQFLIINNVNCKTKDKNSIYIDTCKEWVDIYINTLMPLRGIIFGNYLHENATIQLIKTNNFNTPIIPLVKSILPKLASYNDAGRILLENSVKKLKLM